MNPFSSGGYEEAEYLPHSQTLLENNNQETERQMSVTSNTSNTTSPPVTMSSLPLQLTGSWSIPASHHPQLSPFHQESHLAASKPSVPANSQEDHGMIFFLFCLVSKAPQEIYDHPFPFPSIECCRR